MNRIGDLGFLIAIFWMIKVFGTVTFGDVFSQVKGAPLGVLTGITLLLFVGATGKSAQIPLYTWLPDAMAGPTPVSALIHAATMVTAGIYMIARSNLMFTLAPVTPTVITVIGLATAIFAASIALKQYDIKKVLAYSTVSQLGYMFVALGVGSYTGAVFHVMTHAFFKALLFLGAGSVIYAVHHEQDMRKMGGLKKYMPVTRWTFFIGCYAIAGLPLMSGFFSKDEILAAAFEKSPVYWAVGAITAVMTAFYMFRLYTMIFLGEYRGGGHSHAHGHDEAPAEGGQGAHGSHGGHDDHGHGDHSHGTPHESPSAMTIPLVVLAILAVVAGFIGLPAAFAPNANWLEHFLEPIFAGSNAVHEGHEMATSMEWTLMGVSVALALIATLWAIGKFKRKPDLAEPTGFGKVLENKWYVDELYNAIIVRPLNALGKFLNGIIEKWVIDWLVNGVGRLIQYGSRQLRLLQSGQVGGYVLLMVVGIIVLFIVQLFVFKTVSVTPPVPVK
jgi:NADH-quinone oxidoreductase subunit L